MPGVAAIAKKDPPILCQNDPEKFEVYFDQSDKIYRIVISPLPGGKGFSGPPGFFVQAGGDPDQLGLGYPMVP